jgi:MtrB/PioB family decaheme-associated outer membrane protein
MRTERNRFPVRVISLAVRSALLLMCAAPALALAQQVMSDEVKELVYPTTWFDLGVLVVDQSSTKFGEYNGLNDSGPYVWANFAVHGGSGYGAGDGTTRVDATGTDLGTNSRNLGINVTDQGHWSAGASYDQLRHYTTDGYQTPYQQGQGSNFFSLLPSFGVINSTTTTSNGVITSANKGSQTLTPTQLSQFHGEDVYNQRDTTGVSAGYVFNPEWNFKFDYKRLDESGAKLIGAGSDAYNLTSAGGFNYGGERPVILMNPMEYQVDSFNLALNWTGQQAFASLSYYGSFFHDDYSGVSWSNPFVSGGTGAAPNPAPGTSPGAAFPISTMSTPPNNDFNQINFKGGWIFNPAMKLVGGLSYAHNTQNESYAGTYTTVPNTVLVLPTGSLDGKVDIKHADIKFTDQAAAGLSFAAGARYNERDNKTASYSYTWLDLGGAKETAINTPTSYKREQFDAGADWRIDSSNKLHFGYEYDYMKRWCDNALANEAQGSLSATNAGYYKVASCVQVPSDKENRGVVNYRLKINDAIEFHADYAYGDRKADVNPSFYNPMQANNQGFENFGYLAFFQASRKQNLFKSGVTWQATDKLYFDLNGRYTHDDYYDSALGVQNGKSESANLDVNYTFTEDNSVGGYWSWQKRTRELLTATGRDAVAPLTTLWSNDLADRGNTVGLDGKQRGLLSGKLELREDFLYSLDKTKYVTFLGSSVAPAVGNQGEVPNISNDLKQFRITGSYQYDRHSSILAGYLYQKLKSNDYFYNAYQYGFTPTTLLPTNQQAPSYDVNTVFVAWRYAFQ